MVFKIKFQLSFQYKVMQQTTQDLTSYCIRPMLIPEKYNKALFV